MRFGSVCSGIEAASVAWQPLGWKAQWLSEIEPFPCALLAHHYPNTPNLGDMTQFESWPTDEQHAIDLLCGGTPCQSFSVAGLRKGLDDPRGNLMLTFGSIAAKYRPQWLVWENVPGVLSSNGGRDFGAFLGLLGFLGYGFAYRVLDAQYFGVAQRRRRVFVVGCAGDWRRAAAVLFERHSLSGHPAPRRKTGKAAPTIPSRSTAGGGLGTDFDCDGGLVGTIGCNTGPNGHGFGDFLNNQAVDAGHILAFGGNRTSGPIDVSPALNACGTASGRQDFGSEAFITLFHPTQDPISSTEVCHSIGANDNATAAVAVQASQSGVRINDTIGTLDANYGSRRHNGVMQATQVRRLTPRECERLQGFPDDYTLVPNRGKPAADGPRYKALGNSWAVPNVRWIGKRIATVTALQEAA